MWVECKRWLCFLLLLSNLGGNVVFSMVFVDMKTLRRTKTGIYVNCFSNACPNVCCADNLLIPMAQKDAFSFVVSRHDHLLHVNPPRRYDRDVRLTRR